MKRLMTIACFSLGLVTLDHGSANAGWNNVFQTTCDNCRGSRSSFFAPPADPCCQPPAPSVSYVQRSYYQSYTAYRMETKLEPVTSYYRSYYWEPVTSYKYTSYYDPCTGCSQRVATPTTSYVQRSKCNATTSYVQRCQMVPYTAYRQSYYIEPVVSYYNPCPTGSSAPLPPSNPGVMEGGSQQMPVGPRPGVQEGDGEKLAPQNIPGGYQRSYPPTGKEPPLRMDRISKLDNSTAQLQGTVVRDDRITPRGGAKIFFASSDKTANQFVTGTDPVGRFSVQLPPGEWKMYVTGNDGKAVYHSVVNVKPQDQRFVTVVSR